MSRRTVTEAALVLADGEVFEGEAIGAEPDGGVATGDQHISTDQHGIRLVRSDSAKKSSNEPHGPVLKIHIRTAGEA